MQQKANDPRIQSMYGGDRAFALFALLVLWGTYAFVLWEVLPLAGTTEVLATLGVVGGLVLAFNTASIFAMLRHYGRDMEHIYGLDLHYLDAMKRQKS